MRGNLLVQLRFFHVEVSNIKQSAGMQICRMREINSRYGRLRGKKYEHELKEKRQIRFNFGCFICLMSITPYRYNVTFFRSAARIQEFFVVVNILSKLYLLATTPPPSPRQYYYIFAIVIRIMKIKILLKQYTRITFQEQKVMSPTIAFI